MTEPMFWKRAGAVVDEVEIHPQPYDYRPAYAKLLEEAEAKRREMLSDEGLQRVEQAEAKLEDAWLVGNGDQDTSPAPPPSLPSSEHPPQARPTGELG